VISSNVAGEKFWTVSFLGTNYIDVCGRPLSQSMQSHILTLSIEHLYNYYKLSAQFTVFILLAMIKLGEHYHPIWPY